MVMRELTGVLFPNNDINAIRVVIIVMLFHPSEEIGNVVVASIVMVSLWKSQVEAYWKDFVMCLGHIGKLVVDAADDVGP